MKYQAKNKQNNQSDVHADQCGGAEGGEAGQGAADPQ